MHIRRIFLSCSLVLLTLPCVAAQAPSPAAPSKHAKPAETAAPAQAIPSDKETAATQRQLIELLRLSPTLTTVVARDPSLLADQEYVSRNNPQLAAFLAAHPEVARNPDFYLFTHMHPNDGSPDDALERAVWPEIYKERPGDRWERNPVGAGFGEFVSNMPPLLAFGGFLIAAIWGIRLFVESRRWNRTFKLQSEVHSRLIDKFSTSQELAAYMETEAGKRFLEAAPIPLDAGPQRLPNAVARILMPLQIGTVMILLGVGFLTLRHLGNDYEIPMRVLGTLILMPGVGFILSAGLTWLMAARLGMMPQSGHGPSAPSDWEPKDLIQR